MVDLTLQHPMVASIKVSDRIFNGPSITVGFSMDDFLLMEEDMFKNSKWENLTAQRRVNTLYVNDTDRSIMVNVSFPDTDSQTPTAKVFVDDVNIFDCTYDSGNNYGAISAAFIVPPGQSYRITNNISQAIVWAELRPVEATLPKWKDLTADRQLGVEYTNNTGEYMDITVIFKLTNANQLTGSGKILIDNIEISSQPLASTTPVTISTRIPPGSKYKVMAQYASYQWNELRS